MKPGTVPSSVADDRRQILMHVVSSLEAQLETLESLDLTLAVALLDHTIAETRRQFAD